MEALPGDLYRSLNAIDIFYHAVTDYFIQYERLAENKMSEDVFLPWNSLLFQTLLFLAAFLAQRSWNENAVGFPVTCTCERGSTFDILLIVDVSRFDRFTVDLHVHLVM